ncbi:MAG: hypothetical protein ACK4GL_04000 [Flavobacteriales bacterium]
MFNLSGNESLDVGPDVEIKIIREPCTRLEISNEIPFLRRFFNVYRSIKVCNVGSLPVSEATVQLSYNPEIIPNSSNFTLTNIAPNLYEVTWYDFKLFECKTILRRDSTSCDVDVLDMGISCVNAEIIASENNCSISDAENLLINVEITCQDSTPQALIPMRERAHLMSNYTSRSPTSLMLFTKDIRLYRPENNGVLSSLMQCMQMFF